VRRSVSGSIRSLASTFPNCGPVRREATSIEYAPDNALFGTLQPVLPDWLHTPHAPASYVEIYYDRCPLNQGDGLSFYFPCA
jgi:hypothetical protein